MYLTELPKNLSKALTTCRAPLSLDSSFETSSILIFFRSTGLGDFVSTSILLSSMVLESSRRLLPTTSLPEIESFGTEGSISLAGIVSGFSTGAGGEGCSSTSIARRGGNGADTFA